MTGSVAWFLTKISRLIHVLKVLPHHVFDHHTVVFMRVTVCMSDTDREWADNVIPLQIS